MQKIEKGPIPKYYQLERILRNRISNKEILPNALFPTEMELCDEFDVSRATVRQAIRALELDGLVRREQGRGTIVIPDGEKKVYTKLYGSPDKIFAPGRHYDTTLISKELVIPSQEIISDMNLESDNKVYFFEALRKNELQKTVSYIQLYLSEDIGHSISIENKKNTSLMFRRIEAVTGKPFYKVIWLTKAIAADGTIGKVLNLKKGVPILTTKRIYFTQDNRALEMSLSYHPGDIYQMEMELMMTGR
jgi:GntR family transcriptional regulator